MPRRRSGSRRRRSAGRGAPCAPARPPRIEPEVAPARVAGDRSPSRARERPRWARPPRSPAVEVRWPPRDEVGLGRDRQLRMSVEHQPQERGARARRPPRRTAPAGVRLPPGGGQGRVLAMGVALRRLFWQPRDPLRHSASDRHEPAHYPVTALVKPEDRPMRSRGTRLSWSPSARTAGSPGRRTTSGSAPSAAAPAGGTTRCAATRASSAPRWARRSTTSTSTGRETRRRTSPPSTPHCSPHKPDSIVGEWTPRYLADPMAIRQLRDAAPEAKLLVMFRDPVARYRSAIARLQRMADDRGDRVLLAQMNDAIWRGYLLRAASPRVRPLLPRAGPGAAVRALRRRPGRRRWSGPCGSSASRCPTSRRSA